MTPKTTGWGGACLKLTPSQAQFAACSEHVIKCATASLEGCSASAQRARRAFSERAVRASPSALIRVVHFLVLHMQLL